MLQTLSKPMLLKMIITIIIFSQQHVFAQVANISASPNPATISVTAGATQDQIITLSNSGNTNLDWTITNFYIPGEVEFTKPAFADWTLEENQDRITNNVWITRADIQGIFNFKTESDFTGSVSPDDTEWSYGNSFDLLPGDYTNWRSAVSSDPPAQVGQVISMHAITDDRYFDIEFSQWTSGGGGGFAYTRREYASWLSSSDISGTVTPGGTQDITLTVDAANLPDGTYNAMVVFESNSTNDPTYELPVEVTVTGGVAVVSANASIAYSDTFVGGTATNVFDIANTGLTDLIITDITFDNGAFTSSVSTLTVEPFTTESIEVYFSPSAVQAFAGNMSIASNDAASPTVVTLSGNGIAAPSISLNNTSFTESLAYGATSSQTLTITNNGTGSLDWSIALEVPNSHVFFEKEAMADYTLAENQDRINEDVWITRGGSQGLYNIKVQDSYSGGGPTGSEWASGRTIDVDPINYDTWVSAHGGNPPGMIDQVYSMHLTDNNEYYDVTVRRWGQQVGGGFSYDRTEIPGWVVASSLSGTITTGNSTDVTLDFDANRYGGTYEANLILTNGDPTQSEIIIPISITITGTPTIVLTNTTVDMGSVIIGESATAQFEIQNTGDQDLNISSITSNNTDFTVSTDNLIVHAGNTEEITVTFTPSTSGALAAVLTFVSDDPVNGSVTADITGTGLGLPNITATFNDFVVNLDGAVFNETISINNSEGGDLTWAFNGNYEPAVDGALERVNLNFQDVIDAIPNPFIFAYDGTDYNINDGGRDMYDGANRLQTDLSGGDIIYSDNVVIDGSSVFGTGTTYFTRHLDGLFVLVADLNGVSNFSINGNLGADGGGDHNVSTVQTTVNGIDYIGFVKRVFGTSDPGIHHLIIVEDTEGITRQYSTNTNDDFHQIDGLNNTSRLYYLLFGSDGSNAIPDEDVTNIMDTFLNSILDVPGFVELSATSGSTVATTTDVIDITIDPANVPVGYTSVEFYLDSNDPDQPRITIPITFTGSPKIDISTTALDFGDTFIGHPETQEVTITNTGISDLEISSISSSNGDVTFSPATLTLTAGEEGILEVTYSPTTEGVFSGTVSLTTNDTGNATVDITVDGNGQTPPILDVSQTDYVVKLFTGETFDGNLTIANSQGINLDWTLSGAPAYLTLGASSGSVASGGSDVVTLQIIGASVPSSREIFDVTLTTNDPNNPTVTISFDVQVGNILVDNDIADILTNEGFGTIDVDLSNVFVDADSDPLTYNPASSNQMVVTSSVVTNTLTLTEVGTGSSVISVAATDGSNTAFANFNIRVNAIPQVANPIADQSFENAFASATIDISNVFTDADVSDVLTYSIANSDNNVVTASLLDGIITLTEVGPGTTTVTVTVEDGFGGQISDDFTVFVNKINQTITFDPFIISFNYGDSPVALTATASSSLPVSYTSSDVNVVTVSGSTMTIVGAGTATITASQAGDAAYNAATDVTQDVVINKVPLTVTANNVFVQYGSGIPALTVTYSGFVNGDDEASLDTAPTASTSATATSPSGTYPITVAGGVSNNYNFTYVSGVLTIETVTSTDSELGKLNDKTITFYPNPLSDNLRIVTGNINSSVAIYDLKGVSKIEIDNYKSEESISIKELKSGVYLLKISTADETLVSRIIKK